jgi:hypothetical protein
MNKLIIYPGRFHPFHKGHFSSYQFLTKGYGTDNVFIASTNAQAPLTSPFSFEEKKAMMVLTGVPEEKVVQVKNPYRSEEITGRVSNPEDTALIYALSEKDIGRFSFTKKDGTPGYMQPYPKDEAQLKPMTEHAYVVLTPTVTFKVLGKDANSASQIRSTYTNADDKTRKQMLKDLYGKVDSKVKAIFDKKMEVVEQLSRMMTTLKESRDPMDKNMRKVELALEMERNLRQIEEADMEGHYQNDGKIIPAGGQGSWTADSLKTNIVGQFIELAQQIKSGNYSGAYHTLFTNKAFQSKFEALKLYHEDDLPK